MPTYTLTQTMTAPGKVAQAVSAVAAGAEARIDGETMPATSTNKQFDIAFPVAGLRSLILLASAACTIKTNSSSEPDDTITLAADRAITWDTNSAHECPFSADVTALYVTNTAAGALTVLALYDPTP